MGSWMASTFAAGVVAAGGLTLQTWSAELVVGDLAHVHGIGFDPRDATRLLVATHHGVFAVDTNGDASPVSSQRDDFMGFSVVPGRDDLLVASGHPSEGGNLGLIASADGGVTWEQLSPGGGGIADFHALAVSRADPLTMYGLYRGIQQSTDGGKNWAIVSPGPEATIDLAASAVHSGVVYAATGNGLQRSDDAGRSWVLQGPASPVTMVEVGPDGTIYVFFAGVGLFRADAAGGQWSALNQDLAGREFLHLAIDPTDVAHLVAVTHASEVLESHDGGKAWSAFGSATK